MPDVVVIGHICADVLSRNVDSMPDKGTLQSVDKLMLSTGGCGLNAAVAYSRLGGEVALIGKIGDDGFGDFVAGVLTKHNIDTRGIVRSDKDATSASVVLVDSLGERSFLHCYGANAALTDDDINWNIMDKCRYLAVCGTFLMSSFDGQPAARVLNEAQKRGITTLLDTAWDTSGRWMDILAPCMPFIDVFAPSYDEAVRLSGNHSLDVIADDFLAHGAKNVIIKNGSDGCFLKNRDTRLEIPGFDVEVVDCTGAGDSFVAGMLAGLSRGYTLADSAVIANATGAFSVTAMGATTGIPDFKRLLDFIRQRGIAI